MSNRYTPVHEARNWRCSEESFKEALTAYNNIAQDHEADLDLLLKWMAEQGRNNEADNYDEF